MSILINLYYCLGFLRNRIPLTFAQFKNNSSGERLVIFITNMHMIDIPVISSIFLSSK